MLNLLHDEIGRYKSRKIFLAGCVGHSGDAGWSTHTTAYGNVMEDRDTER